MKILIINPYLGSSYGGVSKIIINQLQVLGNFDISIDVLTTNANCLEKLEVPLNKWIDYKTYRLQYFNCWYRNDFIVSPSLIKWLFQNVLDYDLVHAHTVFSPLISLSNIICQFHNVPYIMTPHGMLEPWALSYKSQKKQLYFNLFEKHILRKSRVIQASATDEANNLKSLGFEHSVVIPNGIQRREFESLPHSDIFYEKYPHTRNKSLILFLGRIDPKKGLDLLAPAFARVHNRFPDTHLVVAGPDSIGFLPTVQKYFAKAECLDAVTFTGMLTGTLKLAALAAANFYVSPSYSEGFSISVLEGMASGLPCVITTGCNFPEAGKSQAAHVVDINTDAIATALIQCLSQPQAAIAMGLRAREFIFQNYTWERSAERLMQVYTAIVNKKPLPACLELI